MKGYVLIGVHGGNLDVLESIWKVAGQEFDISGRGLSELLRWFGRPCRSLGFNGTNLFAVFCESLERRGL